MDTPLTELTDAQYKFMFHADQERERMKSEKLDDEKNNSGMKNKSKIPKKFR